MSRQSPAEIQPPKPMNQANAIDYLTALGWIRTIGGKHNVKMEKPGHRPITLPMHKGRDYGPQLRSMILRQAATQPGDQGGQSGADQ